MDRKMIEEGGVRKIIRQLEQQKQEDSKGTADRNSKDGRTGKNVVMVSLAKIDFKSVHDGEVGRHARMRSVGDQETIDQNTRRELFRSQAGTRGYSSLDTELPHESKITEFINDPPTAESRTDPTGDKDKSGNTERTRTVDVKESAAKVESTCDKKSGISVPRRPDQLPLTQSSATVEIARSNDNLSRTQESRSRSNQDQESSLTNGQVTLPSRYQRHLVSRTKSFLREYLADGHDPPVQIHAIQAADDHEEYIVDDKSRERDMKIALDWIQQEMKSIKDQNRTLFRQLLDLRASLHQLKGMTACQSFDLDDSDDSDERTPDWPYQVQSSLSADLSITQTDCDLNHTSRSSFRSIAEVVRFSRWSDEAISSQSHSVVDQNHRQEYFV